MANIIIPAEHQSAPKTARVADLARFRDSPAAATTIPEPAGAGEHVRGFGPSRMPGDFDSEMDLPETFATPQERAEYEDLQRRGYGKSSAAMIEEAERQFAINEAQMRAARWEGQERWQGKENEEMRLVRIMHPHTIIARLQRAGVAASVHDPYEWFRERRMPFARWPKPAARLWLNSFVKLGRVGITAWVDGEPKTVTALQYPYGPEWSIMRFDRYNVPTNERYRGWRTAMLTLITEGVLSEREVERAFGPAEGPAASFYRQQLYLHRRIFMGLARRDEGAA